MGNPTLTKVLFAALIGTFLISILFGMYSNFIYTNGAEIDEPYNTAFQEIGAKYDDFDNSAKVASNQSVVKNILDFGRNAVTGTVNVFVVGLDAIGSFFSMIPIFGSIFESISTAIPGFSAILGLASTLLALYIAMAYIKSASNKQDLP